MWAPKVSPQRPVLQEENVPSCIVYVFAYHSGPKRNAATLLRQTRPIKRLLHARGLQVEGKFGEFPKNRDRHFANSPAFRQAVAKAKALGCPLVLPDVTDMLSRTHHKLIPDCVERLAQAGVTILNAATGKALEPASLSVASDLATAVAISRRLPIRLGLRSQPRRERQGSSNQPKAAKGTVRAADKRARRLKPEVDAIRDSIPGPLTPTVLARELNARSVLTERGNLWSPTTARNLIKRLADIE
jgi:hypothetical protein